MALKQDTGGSANGDKWLFRNVIIKLLGGILEGLPESSLSAEEFGMEYQIGSTVNSLLAQIMQFIKLGSEGKSNLQLHYFNAAESTLQQAVSMSANLPIVYRHELEKMKIELEKSVALLTSVRSEEALSAVNNLHDKLDLPKGRPSSIRADVVLRKIAAFMQEVGPHAQFITEHAHVSTFTELMASIQKVQTDWQEEQLIRYNRWAVENMEKLIADIKKDDAFYKRTDRDNVVFNMRKYLCSIDTRFLNFGAMQCFNEVFAHYYGMLNEDQKQDVSKALAFSQKRRLDEF